MPEIITRRSFLRVLTGLIAAPAVIQVASLMPLRGAALIVPAYVIDAPYFSFQITGFANTSWGSYKYLDGQWPEEALRHA